MTWKEHCLELEIEISEKQGAFMPTWNELSKIYPAYEIGFRIKDNKEYKEWQSLKNNQMNLLLFLDSNNINPNDEMPIANN